MGPAGAELVVVDEVVSDDVEDEVVVVVEMVGLMVIVTISGSGFVDDVLLAVAVLVIEVIVAVTVTGSVTASSSAGQPRSFMYAPYCESVGSASAI